MSKEIMYRHKEFGYTIHRDELAQMLRDGDRNTTITLHKETYGTPHIGSSVLNYSYEIRDIPFCDDFEPVIYDTDTDFTEEELNMLMQTDFRCMPSDKVHSIVRKIQLRLRRIMEHRWDNP